MGWSSQQYGSFERFLVEVARQGAEHGIATHLVFHETPASQAFLRDVDATVHVLGSARHPADRRFTGSLGRLLDTTGATHLHAHFGLDAYLGVGLAARRGLRTYATKHITPGRSRVTLSRARHRWLARHVERLFAVSDQVAADLVALGVRRDEIDVVRLGVDPEAYRPDPERRARARAGLGLADGQRLVLCTSHLRPGKGVELLPQLAATLPDDVTVAVAGSGPLAGRLQADAERLGVPAERLMLLGVREDVPDLLAAADLFVFPTRADEGLPLGPIEALAAGLPVVATSVSDLPALIGDVARLVAPGDVAALRDACAELLGDPAAAAALGGRARAFVRARMNVRGAAAAHVTSYLV